MCRLIKGDGRVVPPDKNNDSGKENAKKQNEKKRRKEGVA
jgi:hypothetical protein